MDYFLPIPTLHYCAPIYEKWMVWAQLFSIFKVSFDGYGLMLNLKILIFFRVSLLKSSGATIFYKRLGLKNVFGYLARYFLLS
jgi:hypothetical protein